MSEQCLHKPNVTPGHKCDCLECRSARAKVLGLIAAQCVRCAGRCATDRHGQVTCEKGDYDCPVLDLWYSVVNRETDPEAVTAVQVELVFHRRKDPPKAYPRAGVSPQVRFDVIPDPRLEPETPRAPKQGRTAGAVLPAGENKGRRRKQGG